MPVSLTRLQGFPKVRDAEGGVTTVTDSYYDGSTASLSSFRAALPAIGATHPDIPSAFLVDRSTERGPHDGRWDAVLIYKTPSTSGGEAGSYRTEGETEFSLGDGGVTRMLEQATNYRARWNYHLARRPGVTGTFSGYATATSVDLTGADGTNYRWIRDPNELPVEQDGSRWEIAIPKTKPGSENFIQPAPVVTMKAFYKTTGAARTFVAGYTVGKKQAPTETFGLGGEFIIINVECQPDGRYWTGVVKYQNDPRGWDSDLYP